MPRPLFDFLNGVERKTNIVQISYNKTCNDEYSSNAIPVPGLSSGTSESGSAEASPASLESRLSVRFSPKL